MRDTWPLLEAIPFPALTRAPLQSLQVNLGYRCNQSCVHCHIAASPRRTEAMDDTTLATVFEFLRKQRPAILDITGGAPELHPRFRDLARTARTLGIRVIDRCNLTILSEPGQDDLADFLAAHGIDITASLPCYREDNVNAQRGDGVYQRSIDALRLLNARGYGHAGSGRILNLVYNPQGAVLPPPQNKLEADYKRELFTHHGIVFNQLFTLTNMPIRRFGTTLANTGQLEPYLALLRAGHDDANLDGTMCRTTLSVDYRGQLYDCDFNQILGLPLHDGARPLHLGDVLSGKLEGRAIRVAGHCYACTAGQGSSCGGALAQAAE